MGDLYIDSEQLEDELDDAEGITDGTDVSVNGLSEENENTPLYTPGDLIASAEGSEPIPNMLPGLNEPTDLQEEVSQEENQVEGFISNIGGSDAEHIGDNANYRPNYDPQDNAGGAVGEGEFEDEDDDVNEDEVEEEEDDEAGEVDSEEANEEEEIYDEGIIENNALRKPGPISRIVLPLPSTYKPPPTVSKVVAKAVPARVPRIPTVQITSKPSAIPSAVSASGIPKNLVPVRTPVVPSSIPTNLSQYSLVPVTTGSNRKKPAGRKKAAAVFSFPEETNIDVENLIKREPAEDYESYRFREQYTLLLDDLPAPWGELTPSIKVALGFMATKKARYGIRYDTATEALLRDIETQMKMPGVASGEATSSGEVSSSGPSFEGQ